MHALRTSVPLPQQWQLESSDTEQVFFPPYRYGSCYDFYRAEGLALRTLVDLHRFLLTHDLALSVTLQSIYVFCELFLRSRVCTRRGPKPRPRLYQRRDSPVILPGTPDLYFRNFTNYLRNRGQGLTHDMCIWFGYSTGTG